MSVTKEDLKSQLKSLVEDSRSIEGLAVADAARLEGAIVGAYSTIRTLLDSPTPPVAEVSDPGFEQAAAQSQQVADGGQPNVHPVSGEPVPPGSTEGVRPDGTVQADPGVAGNQPNEAGDGSAISEPALPASDPAVQEHPTIPIKDDQPVTAPAQPESTRQPADPTQPPE